LEESLIQSLMPMVRVSIGFGTAIAWKEMQSFINIEV
jgi:hypothetical protein